MNDGYRSQFHDANTKRRLLRSENLPILEKLLSESMQRYQRLENVKNDQQLTREIKENELDRLAHKVYAEVDAFLGFKPSGKPKILFDPRWGFRYNITSKDIIVATLQIPRLIPVIAHEYTHYIQHSKLLDPCYYDIFSEGHARGVERQIAEDHSRKEGNELFLYDILKKTVRELQDAYKWMCERLGKTPKSSLSELHSRDIEYEVFNRAAIFCIAPQFIGEPSKHALGNAFFSIYEALYGKGIYGQMIHGEFKFTKWYQFSSWLNVCNRMRAT